MHDRLGLHSMHCTFVAQSRLQIVFVVLHLSFFMMWEVIKTLCMQRCICVKWASSNSTDLFPTISQLSKSWLGVQMKNKTALKTHSEFSVIRGSESLWQCFLFLFVVALSYLSSTGSLLSVFGSWRSLCNKSLFERHVTQPYVCNF